MAWVKYTGQASHQASEKTHNFPITFTTLYAMGALSHTDQGTSSGGYSCCKSWNNSSVTYWYNINRFIIIVGKI